MTKMRKDAQKTLKLWEKLSKDETELALGGLLLSQVFADKIMEILRTGDNNDEIIKLVYVAGIAYMRSKQNLIAEFNKK